MDFDPLFEDLEARFMASQKTADFTFSLKIIQQATRLDVLLDDGQRLQLLAPLLGQDFAAGLHPAAAIWNIVPLEAIQNIGFIFDEKSDLPTVQLQKFSLMQYLELLPLPTKCSFRRIGQESSLSETNLIGVGHDLLFIQSQHQDSLTAIPVAQLRQLSIGPVHNSHGIS
jgi:hypothetical protein